MTKPAFTEKQLEAITLVRDSPDLTYFEIDEKMGWQFGTTNNRIQRVRNKIEHSQLVVNTANNLKKGSSRLRKVLL